MAIKYVCDSCDCQLTPENGVIGNKEFTIERGKGDKICFSVVLGSFEDRTDEALCANCLVLSFENFRDTEKNFRCLN